MIKQTVLLLVLVASALCIPDMILSMSQPENTLTTHSTDSFGTIGVTPQMSDFDYYYDFAACPKCRKAFIVANYSVIDYYDVDNNKFLQRVTFKETFSHVFFDYVNGYKLYGMGLFGYDASRPQIRNLTGVYIVDRSSQSLSLVCKTDRFIFTGPEKATGVSVDKPNQIYYSLVNDHRTRTPYLISCDMKTGKYARVEAPFISTFLNFDEKTGVLFTVAKAGEFQWIYKVHPVTAELELVANIPGSEATEVTGFSLNEAKREMYVTLVNRGISEFLRYNADTGDLISSTEIASVPTNIYFLPYLPESNKKLSFNADC